MPQAPNIYCSRSLIYEQVATTNTNVFWISIIFKDIPRVCLFLLISVKWHQNKQKKPSHQGQEELGHLLWAMSPNRKSSYPKIRCRIRVIITNALLPSPRVDEDLAIESTDFHRIQVQVPDVSFICTDTVHNNCTIDIQLLIVHNTVYKKSTTGM